MQRLVSIHAMLATTVCVGALCYAAVAHTAMDSRFELNPQLLSSSNKAQVKKARVPAKRTARKSVASVNKNARVKSVDAAPEHAFKLAFPVTALSDREAVTRISAMWGKLVPATEVQLKPLVLQTESFSLALDPSIYPSFARMDGGRIILDQGDTIPPLVKSLIEGKDDSVKIVNEAPSAAKQVIAGLLDSAGFYSVEENFSIDFGVDPRLTIQADFKVERTPESLLKQDIVLINSGRTPLPPVLGKLLGKEGFLLHEPFASLKPFSQHDSGTIHSITTKKQQELIDSILVSLSVNYERNKSVDVYAAEKNGISLAVKTDRYFERGGGRFVVTSFDRDPINYTLLRILETKGYNVIIVEAQDDFRKISEKLLSSMKIKGVFDRHAIVKDALSGYSLQMTGFKIDDPTIPGGGMLLTDRVIDGIVRDVLSVNGFAFGGK